MAREQDRDEQTSERKSSTVPPGSHPGELEPEDLWVASDAPGARMSSVFYYRLFKRHPALRVALVIVLVIAAAATVLALYSQFVGVGGQ